MITATAGPVGLTLSLQYQRLKAPNNPGHAYTPQFVSKLTMPWQDFTGSETVQSIDSAWKRVIIEDTATGEPKRFGRVMVVTGE